MRLSTETAWTYHVRPVGLISLKASNAPASQYRCKVLMSLGRPASSKRFLTSSNKSRLSDCVGLGPAMSVMVVVYHRKGSCLCYSHTIIDYTSSEYFKFSCLGDGPRIQFAA